MDNLPAIPDTMARRATVAKMILRGNDPTLIAAELGVAIHIIYEDMERVRDAWLNLATRSYDQQVAEEIAKINRIEVAAWSAWDASIGNVVKERSKIEADPVLSPDSKPTSRVVSREVTQERKNGDPKYLEVALKCASDRIKLLGLNQPSRHVHLNIESNIGDQKVDKLQERMRQYAGTTFELDDATTVVTDDGLGEPLDSVRSTSQTSPVPHLRRS